jgi:hypothetical protein
MRVTKDDLDKMRAAIEPLDTDAMRAVYRSGEYPRSDRTKDVNVRYRWAIPRCQDMAG